MCTLSSTFHLQMQVLFNCCCAFVQAFLLQMVRCLHPRAQRWVGGDLGRPRQGWRFVPRSGPERRNSSIYRACRSGKLHGVELQYSLLCCFEFAGLRFLVTRRSFALADANPLETGALRAEHSKAAPCQTPFHSFRLLKTCCVSGRFGSR